jgi:hypothetical protein
MMRYPFLLSSPSVYRLLAGTALPSSDEALGPQEGVLESLDPLPACGRQP